VDIKEGEYVEKYNYVEDKEPNTCWIESENERSFIIMHLEHYQRHEGEFEDETQAWDSQTRKCVRALQLEEWIDMDSIASWDDPDWEANCKAVYSVKRVNGKIERNKKCCLHRYYAFKNKQHTNLFYSNKQQ